MRVIPIGIFGNRSKKNDEKSHIYDPTSKVEISSKRPHFQ
jgi:hypothetical protein